jgi:hypothetical protein
MSGQIIRLKFHGHVDLRFEISDQAAFLGVLAQGMIRRKMAEQFLLKGQEPALVI